jgi:hypothetical protein
MLVAEVECAPALATWCSFPHSDPALWVLLLEGVEDWRLALLCCTFGEREVLLTT